MRCLFSCNCETGFSGPERFMEVEILHEPFLVCTSETGISEELEKLDRFVVKFRIGRL